MSDEDNARWAIGAKVGRLIMREMLLAITDLNEFAVLWFVYARTHQFGNLEEKIPVKHFIEGVYDQYGVCWTAPLPIARSTIYRAVDTLVAKGMLNRIKGSAAKAPTYSVNSEWTMRGHLEGNDYLLSQRRDSIVPRVGQMSPACGTNKENDIKDKDFQGCARTRTQGLLESVTKEEAMPTDAAAALRDIVSATTKNTAERRESRKQKLNATALQKIWADAFKKAHPTEKLFEWRVYEQASFKRAIHKSIELSEAREFVEWSVAHFANVIGKYLNYMKSPPRLPAVGFVTSNIATFWLAFEDFRDPNRALRDRVARGKDEPPKFKVKPKPTVYAAKLAELETENKALKDKLRGIGQKEIHRRAENTRAARKLITGRKTRSEEFGGWDDSEG